MPYCPTRPGKFLFSVVIFFLIASGLYAARPPVFFNSSPPGPHILRDFPLYKKDTAVRAGSSGVLRLNSDGDIRITVPVSVTEKYRIRFYTEENVFLFEIRQIRDPLLIVEKYNFGHAGWFRYELYRDGQLTEKNRFQIKD